MVDQGDLHLSIGEVLSLLQPEFPDITISKIRFLESQGLLDPERTPSGYRKFYTADLEQLRWILTQQRDHFLPLKVIKDRLSDASTVLAATTLFESGSPLPPPKEHLAEHHLEASASHLRTEPAEPAEPAVSVSPRLPTETSSLSTLTDQGTPAAAEPTAEREQSNPPSSSQFDREALAEALARRQSQRQQDNTGNGLSAEVIEDRRADPASDQASDQTSDRADDQASEKTATEQHPVVGGVEAAPSEKAYTTERLAEVAELEVAEIEALVDYGLIVGRVAGREVLFDSVALEIAKTAAAFDRMGIEARHLRMYKVTVEREVALYEQIVTPRVRKGQPQAHDNALDQFSELAELGDQLRQALFQRTVSDLNL